jgi:hypothetical protein
MRCDQMECGPPMNLLRSLSLAVPVPVWLLLVAAAQPLAPKAPAPERLPIIDQQFEAGTIAFFGSQPGLKTVDHGRTVDGNPFATAFRRGLTLADASLEEFGTVLRDLSYTESAHFQTADLPSGLGAHRLSLAPSAAAGRRVALVLVVAQFDHPERTPPLAGTDKDGERVAAALSSAGYETTLVRNRKKEAILSELQAFSQRSRSADVALIYVDGHGFELDFRTYLAMTDFDPAAGRAGARDTSIALAEIADAMNAGGFNLVFFGACRNDPFDG